jgi:hypothetical protein
LDSRAGNGPETGSLLLPPEANFRTVSCLIICPVKTCFHLWSLGLGLIVAGPILCEQPQPLPWPTARAPAESVSKKAARLIWEKAGLPNVPEKPESNFPPAESREEVLQLAPMVVREPRPPALPPSLHEAPVRKFLRTGTVWEKVGPKFTTKFGVSGDKGIFFRLSW